MKKIVFIGTVHKEIGQCSAISLFRILEKIRPDVIFLEALPDTYSDYDNFLFTQYNVFHDKLEIHALQLYFKLYNANYVPVLDVHLPKVFDEKFDPLCNLLEYQRLLEYSKAQLTDKGFDFLNSYEGDFLQEKLRVFEREYWKDNKVNEEFDKGINIYEDSMLNNIFSYCDSNEFHSAIFMCGAAHKNSIDQKVRNRINNEGSSIIWENYGCVK